MYCVCIVSCMWVSLNLGMQLLMCSDVVYLGAATVQVFWNNHVFSEKNGVSKFPAESPSLHFHLQSNVAYLVSKQA